MLCILEEGRAPPPTMEAEGDWASLLRLPRLQHMVVWPIASSQQDFYYVRGGKGQAQSKTTRGSRGGPRSSGHCVSSRWCWAAPWLMVLLAEPWSALRCQPLSPWVFAYQDPQSPDGPSSHPVVSQQTSFLTK